MAYLMQIVCAGKCSWVSWLAVEPIELTRVSPPLHIAVVSITSL